MQARLLGLLAASGLLLGVGQAGAASARVGALTQPKGLRGCIGPAGAQEARGCRHARFPGGEIWDLAVSRDDRNAYVAEVAGGVSVFRIRGGWLRQLNGRAGCVSGTGGLGCARVPGLFAARGLATSPDGRNVYVGSADRSRGNGGVLVFRRDRRGGALHRLRGRAGCVGESGGGCAPARGLLATVTQVVVSPDGRNVYVASSDATPAGAQQGAVAVFTRGRHGTLRQPAGSAGCLDQDGSDGCARANAVFQQCCGIAVSPDSRYVYVSSSETLPAATRLGVAALRRDPASGGLVELPGCLTQDGSHGCAAAPFSTPAQLNQGGDLELSPNGHQLYLAHSSTAPESGGGLCGGSEDFIAVIARDPRSGALGPLAQDANSCGLHMGVSADGRSVYASSDFGGFVSIFRRAGMSGLLSSAGCVHGIAGPDYCVSARALEFPGAMALTRNGRYAYVAGGSTLAVFKRSTR